MALSNAIVTRVSILGPSGVRKQSRELRLNELTSGECSLR